MRVTSTKFVAILLLTVALFGGVVVVTGPDIFQPEERQTTSTVVPPDDVESLHASGYTGSNVSLGIIDVTGVDVDHPAAIGSLVEARTFGGDIGTAGDRPDGHGTATVSLVNSVAPDADLYFASIDGEQTFDEAITWLLEADVDVIVAPVSFFGKPDDGTSLVGQAATRAVDEGVVFVAPAGNLGESHWRSRFLPSDDGYQRFGGEPRNPLDGGDEQAVLWLSWEGSDHEFTLELYREGEADPLARSSPYDGDDYPNERLVAAVDPDDSLSFALRGPNNATGTTVRVTSPTHEFGGNHRPGSLVAPGTARGVLTVGAYDRETSIVESFSSAGPTADDRTGIDVIAPNRFELVDDPDRFVGTSAAAPYVSGIVALLLDADPSLTPDEVAAVVRETADETPPYDDELRVGGGKLQPELALETVLNRTRADR